MSPSAPRLLAPWLLASAAVGLPASKEVINGMAVLIRGHVQWNNWTVWSHAMAPFWAENFTYDFIYPYGRTHGLRDWYHGEHLHYNYAFPNFKSNPFLFLGTDDSASIQSYHLVHWVGTFGGVPAPPGKPLIKIKDLDFYIMGGGKILYNWCMVDLVAILHQGGYEVLPPPPMHSGIDYLPPRAMDGIPAPDSNYVDPTAADRAAVAFNGMLQEDLVGQKAAARWWSEDMVWCGPAAIGDAHSKGQYVKHFLKPLHAAFSEPQLHIDRQLCEGTYCGAHLHLVAKHTGMWLGQPATGKTISLRFAMHVRVKLGSHVDGCGACSIIEDGWAQLDIVEAFSQMGVDLLARAKAQYPSLVAKAAANIKLAAEEQRSVQLEDVQLSRTVAATIGAAQDAGRGSSLPALLLMALLTTLGVLMFVAAALRKGSRRTEEPLLA